MNEVEVRMLAFAWLNERCKLNAGVLTYSELANEFKVENKRVTLIGATGIWTPKGFSIPISITTVSDGPYPDSMSDDGILTYKYRGSDPNHRDNVGLRSAFKSSTQLIYFKALGPGRYNAFYPVRIVGDNPSKLEVKVDLTFSAFQQPLDFDIDRVSSGAFEDNLLRKYSTTLVKQRMHQSAFRERVIVAYRKQCTVCGIRHEELLDAAHIIPDNELKGDPIIPNGLSLCKIHHASFDKMIIGISPDYKIKVREDVLVEEDGDMLRYGLQATEGKTIRLPQKKLNYPDKERLEIVYQKFLDQ